MKCQLSLRPIHLTRPELMIKEAGHSIFPVDVLKQSCQLNQVGIKGSTGYSLTVTEMTEQQLEWAKLYDCENLLKPKALKQITKSL